MMKIRQIFDLIDQGVVSHERFSCLAGTVDFWLRPVADWLPPEASEPDRFTSLLKFLFVLYPVPEFLLNENFRESKWLYWLILLGRGGSLRKAASYFEWSIPKRFIHFLWQAPGDLSAESACQWAEIHRLGGQLRDFARIQSLWPLDVTSRTSECGADIQFWRSTAQWLIGYRDELKDVWWYDHIKDWAFHLHLEASLNNESFSWKGRTPGSAHRKALAYAKDKAQNREVICWPSHHLDWIFDKYQIVELTNSQELYKEGCFLNHCVNTGRYIRRCCEGKSAIFSLREEQKPIVTLELDLESGHLLQAKGRKNRTIADDEMRIVQKWLCLFSTTARSQ